MSFWCAIGWHESGLWHGTCSRCGEFVNRATPEEHEAMFGIRDHAECIAYVERIRNTGPAGVDN